MLWLHYSVFQIMNLPLKVVEALGICVYMRTWVWKLNFSKKYIAWGITKNEAIIHVCNVNRNFTMLEIQLKKVFVLIVACFQWSQWSQWRFTNKFWKKTWFSFFFFLVWNKTSSKTHDLIYFLLFQGALVFRTVESENTFIKTHWNI